MIDGFSILIISIAVCYIVEKVCETVVELRNKKNKGDEG